MEKRVVEGPFPITDRPLEPGVLGYYYTVTTVYKDDGVTPIRILKTVRPILTDEEREKRYAAIKEATIRLILAADRVRAEKGLPPRQSCEN